MFQFGVNRRLCWQEQNHVIIETVMAIGSEWHQSPEFDRVFTIP